MSAKKVSQKLFQLLDRLESKTTYDQLGEQAARDIVERTRLGAGVSNTGEPAVRLKGLKKSTIDRRERLRKQGKLSSNTRPSKSNLTATGAMLGSVKHKASNKKATVGTFSKTQEAKIQDLADRGFKFMFLSKREIDRLTKTVSEAVLTALKQVGL